MRPQTNLIKEGLLLESMSVKELSKKWGRYFDKPPRSKTSKRYLVSEILYRMQELAYGGLTTQTIDRLEALSKSKAISNSSHAERLKYAIGTRFIREFKGVEHEVIALKDGCEHQGFKYKTLSGVTYAIAGKRWSGNELFGIHAGEQNKRGKRRVYAKGKYSLCSVHA